MEVINLPTIDLCTFDKNISEHVSFLKSLLADQDISCRFQGIGVGLLHSCSPGSFLGRGFFLVDNHVLSGYVNIGSYNEQEAAVYVRMAIDKNYRGEHLGSRALVEITDHILERYDSVNCVKAYIAPDNIASLKIANRCGFQWEKNNIYYKGRTIERSPKQI